MKKLILIVAVVFALFSCEQNDYLVDGGVSDAKVEMTTMEFIKSHPQLDTVAILIDRAGLADEVNGNSTLFVANNLSVRRYVDKVLTELRKEDPLAEYTINDIPTDTLTKYMGGYIFPERITRDDLVKEGAIYTAINGEQRRISLEPQLDGETGYGDQLSSAPGYVYYTYKDGDEWDEWDNVTNDTRVIVRTSNIISTNGIIHVLQGSHTLFNFDIDE
ncbi:fasciclin domain-containing protein [Sunxiuqinia sp. sy24]|uniref:fasciclin domain-containing protein n=1 Tax=Sunxiuqinia sp. sy24 TaxID=3461495 RepID=UPI00404545BA